MMFYVFFNTYTGYLFWTNTYYQQDYFITSTVAWYELLNTFYEFRNTPLKKEMIAHHALTSANSFMLLYSYNISPEFVKDIMICQTLAMSSTLYLNIRHIFPQAWEPRIVFFLSFFYYRFYLPYPYIYKMLTLAYGDTTIIRIFYVNYAILYSFSIYWGYLILRIAYKILAIQNCPKLK
jgi:hypothetical protein